MLANNERVVYNYGLVDFDKFPRIEKSREDKGSVTEYKVPEGVEALAVKDGVIKWAPVQKFSVHRNLSMVEVSTNSGRTIHCSSDHSLIAIDDNLAYTPTVPTVGLVLPRLRKVCTSPAPIYSTINLYKEGSTSKYTFSNNVPIDRNLGYFTGVYIGDGWASLQRETVKTICLANISDDLVEEIRRIIQSYIVNDEKLHIYSLENDHEFNGYKCHSSKHSITSDSLYDYIMEHIGHLAENKHLPSFWVSTSTEFRWGILSGLIDTDGSVSTSIAKSKKIASTQISLCTTSRELAYQVVGLAHSLDLTASVTISKTPAGSPCYYVHFSQESIKKMQQLLVLHVKEKQEVLSKMQFPESVTTCKYAPPLSDNRMAELAKTIGSPRLASKIDGHLFDNQEVLKKRKSLYACIHNAKGRQGGNIGLITRDTAEEIIKLIPDLFKEENTFWAKWKSMVEDKNMDWERVVSITPLPDITEAYDLTIPDFYTMVTESGIVVQDTMSFHVPVGDKAVAQAKSKMLPSQNLFRLTTLRDVQAAPEYEMLLGLYQASKPEKGKAPKSFATTSDAKQAYRRGEIDLNDPIVIRGK